MWLVGNFVFLDLGVSTGVLGDFFGGCSEVIVDTVLGLVTFF